MTGTDLFEESIEGTVLLVSTGVRDRKMLQVKPTVYVSKYESACCYRLDQPMCDDEKENGGCSSTAGKRRRESAGQYCGGQLCFNNSKWVVQS